LDVETAITELGVGEALVSFLDVKGIPMMVERALILPPCSQIGPITPDERKVVLQKSFIFGVYEKLLDRESAFEILKGRMAETARLNELEEQAALEAKEKLAQSKEEAAQARAEAAKEKAERARKKANPDIFTELTKQVGRNASRTLGNELGRTLIRGLFGTLFGGSRRK
jgi:hypothetical protein